MKIYLIFLILFSYLISTNGNYIVIPFDSIIYPHKDVGLEDLKNRRVRFVGNAKKRMLEDHLRLLRYFRFWAKMGDGQIDPTVQAALPKVVPLLAILSLDRRRDEMFKIITGPRARRTLKIMQEFNVLNESLLQISFSKKQRAILANKALEKMLATFGFSGYNKEKGVSYEK